MHCIPICSVRLMMMLLLIFFLGYFHYYQLPLPLPPPPSTLCACCCTLCFRCYYCGWRVCVSHSLCAHFFAFIRSFIRWFGRSLLLFDFYCLGWRLYASFAHTYINFDSDNLFIYLSFQIQSSHSNSGICFQFLFAKAPQTFPFPIYPLLPLSLFLCCGFANYRSLQFWLVR